MIKFKPKVEPVETVSRPAAPADLPSKTTEQKPADSKRPDSDGKMRRMRQTQDDNRLL